MASKYAMTSRESGKEYHKDEDFEEGDVWCVTETEESSSSPKKGKFKDSSSSSAAWSLPSAPRHVPKPTNFPIREANHQLDTMFKQASAPMEIIDRRKSIRAISGSKEEDVGSRGHDGSWHNYGHRMGDGDHDGGDGDGDDIDDEEEELLPPHEYIVRRLARTHISTFSVCEGIGRTLKGRDLSQVRNAILRSTGFIES